MWKHSVLREQTRVLIYFNANRWMCHERCNRKQKDTQCADLACGLNGLTSGEPSFNWESGFIKGHYSLVGFSDTGSLEDVESEGCCNCVGVRWWVPSTGMHRRERHKRHYAGPYSHGPRQEVDQERGVSVYLILLQPQSCALLISWSSAPLAVSPSSQNSSLWHIQLANFCSFFRAWLTR